VVGLAEVVGSAEVMGSTVAVGSAEAVEMGSTVVGSADSVGSAELAVAVEVATGAEVAAAVVDVAADVDATGAEPEPPIVKSTQDSSKMQRSENRSEKPDGQTRLTSLINGASVPPPLKHASTRRLALAAQVRWEGHAKAGLVGLNWDRGARIDWEHNQRRADDRVRRGVDN
jgi:hypothetical protein